MRRRLLTQCLTGFGLAVAVGTASAQAPPAPMPTPMPKAAAPAPAAPAATTPGTLPTLPGVPCPPVNCPTPGMPGMPGLPGQPGANPTDPGAPGANTPSFDSTQAPSAGTGARASNAPNLMGDLLGARPLNINYTRNLTATFPNATPSGSGVIVAPNAGTFTFSGNQGANSSLQGPFPGILPGVTFNQPTTGGNVLSASDAAFGQAALQSLLSTSGLSPAQIAALPPDVRAALNNPAVRGSLTRAVTGATGGLPIGSLNVGPVSGTYNASTNTLTYTAALTGQTTVVAPSAGGVVGRIKLSEENNPLPRDRVVFVYDHFSNTPLAANGINVDRFQFGLEKTFLNGRASLEFRLPFAGTVNSTNIQGMESSNTELGNVRFAAKVAWLRRQTFAFSTGVGVTLPTADDINVRTPDGVQLYTLKNQSVQLEPFAALLLTPTDRLFGQFWTSMNFDASGSNLTLNRQIFGTDGTALRYFDRPILALDGQVGYWVIRNDFGTVRGLAPFLELHWNKAINELDAVSLGANAAQAQGLVINAGGASEFNITAGVTTQFSNNLSVTVGASAPLQTRPDRTFDAQLGVRVNWLFGRTARDYNSAYGINGF